MTHIDEARLETDLGYRFGYVAGFIGFGPDDVAAVHGAAPLLAPLVPGLVDAVYDKLHTYDATWRHFLPRQHGYAGDVPDTLDRLTMDHPQIAFRKQHLGRYLANLVTKPYDGKMLEYLETADNVERAIWKGELGDASSDEPRSHIRAGCHF